MAIREALAGAHFHPEEWRLTRLCEKSDNTMGNSGHGFRGAATTAAKLQLDGSVIQDGLLEQICFHKIN